MNTSDIFQEVPDEDIPKLRELCKKDLPRGAYICNYLEAVANWKTKRPEKNFITLMAPLGNWESGIFVSIHEYSCYEIFVFTLEENCKTLCEALINTKRIKWNNSVLMYAVHTNHYPKVLDALNKTTFKYYYSNPCDIVWISKEKALQFEIECPPEVYIGKLDSSHAEIIDSHWPHRFKDSDKYIATMIELGGGYGAFLKSDGTLVAWVLRNLLGLAALQTANDHKRKGYGTLMAKVLSKDMAEKGADPLGTVLIDNAVSHAMFKKLGFQIVERVVFIESQELREVE